MTWFTTVVEYECMYVYVCMYLSLEILSTQKEYGWSSPHPHPILDCSYTTDIILHLRVGWWQRNYLWIFNVPTGRNCKSHDMYEVNNKYRMIHCIRKYNIMSIPIENLHCLGHVLLYWYLFHITHCYFLCPRALQSCIQPMLRMHTIYLLFHAYGKYLSLSRQHCTCALKTLYMRNNLFIHTRDYGYFSDHLIVDHIHRQRVCKVAVLSVHVLLWALVSLVPSFSTWEKREGLVSEVTWSASSVWRVVKWWKLSMGGQKVSDFNALKVTDLLPTHAEFPPFDHPWSEQVA